MTPEGRVKEDVKKLLREYNAYWFCPVQTALGDRALDFMHVQVLGAPTFAIETKAPGKTLTPKQCHTVNRIVRAGGTVFVIDGDLQELRAWLQFHHLTRPAK